jgi:hypothetical protein
LRNSNTHTDRMRMVASLRFSGHRPERGCRRE